MTDKDNPTFLIRAPKPNDREAWEILWNDYLVFYEATIPQANTDILWERLFDDDHPIRALVAERISDSQLIGIAHFFPHADTWEVDPVCYLQDIYVAKDARLKGVGAGLIRQVWDYAKQQDWIFVYWQTEEINNNARFLYDKLTGGTTGFITYQLGERTAKFTFS
jgi:GNAT superfamily N-acetyltransferase